MPTFEFPSSVPSTPGSNARPKSNFFEQHPSTTPAGPPPSQAKSFTPAGPPTSLFGLPSTKPKNPPPTFSFGNDKQIQTKTQTTKVQLNDVSSADEDAEGEEDMEVEYPDLPPNEGDAESDDAYDWNAHGESTRQPGANNASRTANRAAQNGKTQLSTSMLQGIESALGAAAKALAPKLGEPVLDESDDLIVRTEIEVSKMYKEGASNKEQEEILERALKIIPEQLSKVWHSCCNEVEHSTDEERGDGVGPLDQDPALYKATYVASFLLLINHPPARILHQQQNLRMSISNKAVALATTEAYPKALKDWLESYHNPNRTSIARLYTVRPNPAASTNFWDLLLSQILRGQIASVADLLANADMSVAFSAKEDGSSERGYKNAQLQAASKVVGRAAARLKACPAIQTGDWEITGDDWTAWRFGIEEELAELIRMAEGDARAADFRSSFDADNFGLSTRSHAMSTSTRRAQSKVPWTVYSNLKTLYHVILGRPTEIMELAGDWLEATLGLTIWWNGSDSEDLNFSSNSFRRSGRKQSTRERMVDVSIVKAYRQRLLEAFDAVTSEETLRVDEKNPVEVAIGCILEGDIQDAFVILRRWSIPITAATMEVGAEAEWYESVHSDPAPDLFDESDLLVLSYAKPEQPISKDSVLVEYANFLLARQPMHYNDQQYEGWELAIELSGRIDNINLGVRTVQEIIKGIAITDDKRADKLISICKQYDLHKEAAEIAEKYGDTIPETTGSYGTALIYYARAHNTRKVKNILDLLISYCLVQSTAFPAADKLDNYIGSLLHKPRELLSLLAEEDTEAAEILSAQFSGYATIRKFYEIRDEAHNKKYTSLRDRKKAALSILLTAIQSAADNIQGGLYDVESPAIIPVDGLLSLLGEVSVFVSTKPRLMVLPQLLVLLRAIEDLDAVHSRIKVQCSEFFSSTLAAAHGAQQPDPKELLQKSISNLTASTALSQSTGFSLLGESIMGSGIGSSYADVAASGSKTKDAVKRTWDWRNGYRRDATPGKLIKKLRLGLAEEVGLAWLEEGL